MILILLRVKLDRWINIPNTFYFIDHYGKTIDNLYLITRYVGGYNYIMTPIQRY